MPCEVWETNDIKDLNAIFPRVLKTMPCLSDHYLLLFEEKETSQTNVVKIHVLFHAICTN